MSLRKPLCMYCYSSRDRQQIDYFLCTITGVHGERACRCKCGHGGEPVSETWRTA